MKPEARIGLALLLAGCCLPARAATVFENDYVKVSRN